jgi:hypothetical protein
MKRIFFVVIVALALPVLVFAQAKGAPVTQTLIIDFIDGSNSLSVKMPDGSIQQLAEGQIVPKGAVVATDDKTTAELRLKPNGTVIKMARKTQFSAVTLSSSPAEPNVFALAAGKVRTIAAKGAVPGQVGYEYRSQTAACGVRGTDFTFDAGEDGTKGILGVITGDVEFWKIGADGAKIGESIRVLKGMAADASAAAFEAFKMSADQLKNEFGDLAFDKNDPNDVPGHIDETESPVVKWLRDILGMEFGSVSINGTNYAKAVIQPEFDLGKVKFGLYLPIIYTSDLFNPSDWYHPNGNDEWSFGTDKGWKDHPLAAAWDATSDLVLKFKYFELGEQYKDNFFIKLGNLEDMTLGHGLIMRNYANDSEFPAIRRVGLNLGLGFGEKSKLGLEAIANDLADPEIFGGRVFFKPFSGFALAFGASGVLDINPTAGLSAATVSSIGDPMMLGAGLDLELPIIKADALNILAFADVAAETEYLREASTVGSGHAPGLAYDLIYSNGTLSNWGAAAGFLGNVLFIDYRLEFRYFTGMFQPSLFGSSYDTSRAEVAVKYASFIGGTAAIDRDSVVMGVYGEGGFSLLKDKLSLKFGYMWPWAPGQTMAWQLANAPDEFHAKVVVKKGLIPIYDVSGAIFYDKRGLASSISDGTFSFFDANTSFGGELDLPVPKAPGLNIAVIFSAVPERNPDGSLVLDTNNFPKMKPSMAIETRFKF